MPSPPTWCWWLWRWRSGVRRVGTSGSACPWPRWWPPWRRRRCLRSSACWRSAGSACGWPGSLLGGRQDGYPRLLDDPVDQAVLDGLLRREEVVAVGVALDALQRLARVLGDELVQHAADTDDLAGVDVEVARLTLQALAADQRLVHVDGGARQREPLALRAGHKDDGAEARRTADADCGDARLHVLQLVGYGEARRHRSAWGVDVDLDLLLRVVRGQVHELGDHQVGHDIVDGPADQDDAVLQQSRVDVKGPLAVAALVLDDRRDVCQLACELTTNGARAF